MDIRVNIKTREYEVYLMKDIGYYNAVLMFGLHPMLADHSLQLKTSNLHKIPNYVLLSSMRSFGKQRINPKSLRKLENLTNTQLKEIIKINTIKWIFDYLE